MTLGRNTKIDILLESGVYQLGFDGASGKTRLYHELASLAELPEYKDQILLLTYNKNLTQQQVIDLLDKFDGDLVMLDRLDLYYSEDIEDALYRRTDWLVLADVKQSRILNRCAFNPAEVIMPSNDRIMVEAL